MFALLDIGRSAERPHQSLSNFGVLSARLRRPIGRRSWGFLFTRGWRRGGRPKRVVLPSGHCFPNLAGEDFRLRADDHLQDIASWTNHPPRSQASERRLVNQSIVHQFKTQARRAGVHEFKILITTQGPNIANRPGKNSRRCGSKGSTWRWRRLRWPWRRRSSSNTS